MLICFLYHSIKWSGGGSVNVKFSDISFSIGVNLGVDGSGKPKIKAGKCSCDSGPVKVKFRGGLAWIYNLFSGKVGKIIASQFQSKMCGIIQDLIDKNAQESLSTIKVEVQLGEFLTLDYRLLAAPTVTSEYIEADLKGEIFWKSDKSEAPFTPPAMATITDNKKMVYITLSEYIFNTMTYQAHKHNILVFNLTSQNIKSKDDALNTTCTDICIGKLIPQIGKSFPNSKVELHMKSSKPPVTSITDGNLGVAAQGDIDLYARKPDKTLHHLFQIAGTGSIAVKLTINETVIHGSVEDMKIKLNVSKSSIGPVNEKALQFLVDSAIKTTITPMLNDLGTKGFPMPSTDNLKLNQFDFKLLQNTMLIETNLKYIPEPTKIKSTMCGIVQNLIDNNAQKSLSTMKVQVKLGKVLTLDYRLMSAPKATPQYMEASLKGEILWTSDKTEAPFAPQSMAPITDSKKMVYITLSDYVFNTMFYQAHKHNMLVFNLTSKNKASIKVNLSIANEMIHGKLYDTKIQTKVTNSAIGTINDRALQFLVDSAIITTIEPMINGLGTTGFPMPSTNDLQFQQSGIKLLSNTILIETDLKYAPKSTVLKFVPMNERYLAIEI
ncbi:lipopolysaccharide-binding protein [Mytilus galloprovincialis]|uniref:Lipopolysaccharide-binding protein n=1 Tax=Mytilus galloprovincialis TaxID=29158 RepID=A0A8B6BK11_MYTGA|nr:lipopolysaccharide-binding protein [Mytilus galloprovincialis]